MGKPFMYYDDWVKRYNHQLIVASWMDLFFPFGRFQENLHRSLFQTYKAEYHEYTKNWGV